MGETARGAAFGLFVSSVEGRPVSRFGSKELIGASRDPEQRNKIVYDTKAIVGIPEDEARRYRSEYQRLIDEGDLVARDEKSWRAQSEQRAEARATREKLLPERGEPKAEG